MHFVSCFSRAQALILLIAGSTAAAQQPLQLPEPQTTGGKPLMQALAERRTTRVFRDEGLSPRTLSNLLWAAFGVNRPRDLKLGLGRTAPSAMNKQEVEIYVVLAKSFISMTPRPTSLSRMATYGQRWARGTRPTRRRPLCTLLSRAMILPRSM